jgi:hypothetical protein
VTSSALAKEELASSARAVMVVFNRSMPVPLFLVFGRWAHETE